MGEAVSPGATRCAGTDPPTSIALRLPISTVGSLRGTRLQRNVWFFRQVSNDLSGARKGTEPPSSLRVIGSFFILSARASARRHLRQGQLIRSSVRKSKCQPPVPPTWKVQRHQRLCPSREAIQVRTPQRLSRHPAPTHPRTPHHPRFPVLHPISNPRKRKKPMRHRTWWSWLPPTTTRSLLPFHLQARNNRSTAPVARPVPFRNREASLIHFA
jgi:hypothetical protein